MVRTLWYVSTAVQSYASCLADSINPPEVLQAVLASLSMAFNLLDVIVY